jgi:hypothetical protein
MGVEAELWGTFHFVVMAAMTIRGFILQVLSGPMIVLFNGDG